MVFSLPVKELAGEVILELGMFSPSFINAVNFSLHHSVGIFFPFFLSLKKIKSYL